MINPFTAQKLMETEIDTHPILVAAPRFPAINQPWIDTYLEQLLKASIEPAIITQNGNSKVYGEKVDRLKLKERIRPLPFGKQDVFRSFVAQVFKRRALKQAWLIAKRLTSNKKILAGNFLLALHFVKQGRGFKDVRLIHSHSEIHAYRMLPLALLNNIPLVLTFHGLPPSGVGQLSAAKREQLYRLVSSVLVNTKYAKAQVLSLGCDPAKVIISPQGLPIDDFPFVAHTAPKLKEPLKLLSVGRFHRDKGQGYALLSLRRLLNKGIAAHWTFIGVGPEKARLEKLAKRLRLGGAVEFIGGLPIDQLRQFYYTSHLLVLSSVESHGLGETQGVVLQEAQATGCIPIASAIGGIPECVNHREDALLVKQRSSRALCDAIEFLLDNPDLWDAYQRAGRLNVEENFSADVIGQKMGQLLKATIANWQGYPG